VQGSWTLVDGEPFYRIDAYDRLRPFFMTLVSSADHWLFLSSTGALTAGRGNPDQALFPYQTDDKIHDAAETTGPKTLLIVRRRGRRHLWEPFSARYARVYRVHRALYKNRWGNQLIFEERNEDLALTFRYGWFSSEQYGFVRMARLAEAGAGAVRVRLLDGLQNLMPCGVGSQFQLEKSTLLDAYKRSELDTPTGLALFRLSSIPVDRPEPAEALRATAVWSAGLKARRRLLSSAQVDRFRQDLPVADETDVRGERGAYWIEMEQTIGRGGSLEWMLVADVGRGPSDVVALKEALRRPGRLQAEVRADVERGTRELRQIVATADGLQQTANPMTDARHGSNVLCNVMRGGVFANGYLVSAADVLASVARANRAVAGRHAAFFRRLKPRLHIADLAARAAATGDLQLERLCREYLPLTFSRRHGDPSRPWNRFSIAPRKRDGTRVLHYEGNWRDLFQNWEALAWSFPGFVEGMICRFGSASTADGYNPYRLTQEGIDWEVPDPADPWAHIGYWGDHQIIYLLKLLEILESHDPAALEGFLLRDLFAYANVPYRIHPYERLLENPKETVVFDPQVEALVWRRVQAQGADGKLVWDNRNRVLLVNLTEKLLVSILAKISNFIPEAGIWLNTQRPEWNDANNALVGNGVSMVTLHYLRRHLAFCRRLFGPLATTPLKVSVEVRRWLRETAGILERHRPLLAGRLGDVERRRVLDDLGRAGSRYRQGLYRRGLSGQRGAVPGARLLRFFDTALAWADHAIAANQRPDRLHHAYNLVRFDAPGALPIRRLPEMLEGQVAALSSGRLSPAQSADVLEALRQSAMYRGDQHSYLLYPNRDLPRYLERNRIPARDVRRSRLLRALIEAGDSTLIERDLLGHYHFSGALINGRDVAQALSRLAESGYRRPIEREARAILDLFERLFDHESFTGRSGTFFAYEGLGSIYWHMVSKLLLAIIETHSRALESGADPAVLGRLARAYHEVRDGLGDRKTPLEYGAFPADPYSHTPAHAGARQPGLTGQVKEDILCRWGELGIVVRDGRLGFRPRLLRRTEFLSQAAVFAFHDLTGRPCKLRLPEGSLGFTYGQVPVVYRLTRRPGLAVRRVDGTEQQFEDTTLDAATSRSVFLRTGEVERITVSLAPHDFPR